MSSPLWDPSETRTGLAVRRERSAYLKKFEGQVLKFEEQRDRLLARQAQREVSPVS